MTKQRKPYWPALTACLFVGLIMAPLAVASGLIGEMFVAWAVVSSILMAMAWAGFEAPMYHDIPVPPPWENPRRVGIGEHMRRKDQALFEQVRHLPISTALQTWFDKYPEDIPDRWKGRV